MKIISSTIGLLLASAVFAGHPTMAGISSGHVPSGHPAFSLQHMMMQHMMHQNMMHSACVGNNYMMHSAWLNPMWQSPHGISNAQQMPNSYSYKNGIGNTNGNKSPNTNTNTNNNNNANNNNVNVNVSANAGRPNSSGGAGNNNSVNGNNTGGNGGGGYSPSYSDGRAFTDSSSWEPSYSPTLAPSLTLAPSVMGYSGAVAQQAAAAPAPAINGPAENPATAWLTVQVSHDKSELYLNNRKMPQKGLTRKYITPPLKPNTIYHYALKVIYPNSKGMKRVYNFNIELKAGDEIMHVVPTEDNQPPPLPKEGVPQVKPPQAKPIMTAQQTLEKRLLNRIELAKLFLSGGKPDKYRKWLRQIIEEHPRSRAAEIARFLLEQQQGN